MSKIPEIFALGSCRLIAPMHALARRNAIKFTNEAQSWYAHSAAEMIQRLDHIEGKRTLPAAILPDVLNTDSCDTPPETALDPMVLPEIGVFEISTRNSFWRDGYILHSTLVRKNNIVDVKPNIAKFEELSEHVLVLAGRFKNLVIGCNIAYLADLKTPNQNRLQMNYFLKAMGHKIPNITVVDPNEIIDPVEPAKDLEDPDHFKPHMEGRVAWFYQSVFKKLL